MVQVHGSESLSLKQEQHLECLDEQLTCVPFRYSSFPLMPATKLKLRIRQPSAITLTVHVNGTPWTELGNALGLPGPGVQKPHGRKHLPKHTF